MNTFISVDINNLTSGILNNKQVSGFTHCFYNYPARFSPNFCRSIIEEYSSPGDIVLDPFMGGGTSMVEATILGRKAIGIDINELAVFITEVKTTLYTDGELLYFKLFTEHIIDSISINRHFDSDSMASSIGELQNVNTKDTWRITRLLSIYRKRADGLPKKLANLFRCVLLKSGQWAFDNNRQIPKIHEFRLKVKDLIVEFIEGAKEYRETILQNNNSFFKPLIFNTSTVNINRIKNLKKLKPPKLIVTSPPYPGVHVLYHRWQIFGRRETAAPYWIANLEDGHGESYYTFGPRYEQELNSYYEVQYKAFKAISKIIDANTIVVQLVAFPHPNWQLRRFLDTMTMAGFKETDLYLNESNELERIWRDVPNRKWYSQINTSTQSNKEVLLVHKLI